MLKTYIDKVTSKIITLYNIIYIATVNSHKSMSFIQSFKT